MGAFTLVELVCSVLSIAGAVVLVTATFASKNAYDFELCSSSCALYAKFEDGFECGKKGVCDTALFAGFATFAVGVLFVLLTILVILHELRTSGQDGRLSRVRCLTFLKLILSILCAVGLLAIAIMISGGAALYCDSRNNAMKKELSHVDLPSCRKLDELTHEYYEDWPSKGFLTMEVMMAGGWISFVFWLFVVIINAIEYRRSHVLTSVGFQEMKDPTPHT